MDADQRVVVTPSYADHFQHAEVLKHPPDWENEEETVGPDLSEFINLTAEILEGLRGVKPVDRRMVDCQGLIRQLLYHASTVHLLSNRPVSYQVGDDSVGLYMFPAGMVLTRSLLETFQVFHHVFVVPSSEDEREFRYCCWWIAGLVVQEGYLPITPNGDALMASGMDKLEGFRTRLQKTSSFLQLKEKEKKQALKGKVASDRRSQFSLSGLAPESLTRAYAYTSSFVHADGHACHQISLASTPSETRELFSYPLLVAKITLSKLVLALKDLFPEAAAICEGHPGIMHSVDLLSAAAAMLDDRAERERARLGFKST